MAFLQNLNVGDYFNNVISATNEQMGTGENTARTIDAPDPNDPNKMVAFGALGAFANKIDQSAQRSYVESGYIRNVKPQYFEITMQEPETTVLVKKRMFSTLIDNYNVNSMDSGDRNFYKASKRLFQNKCQAISVYEKLCKIEKTIQNKGVFNDYFVPILVSGIQSLEALGVNIVSPKVKDDLDQIRKLMAFSEPLNYTTWLVDPNTPFDFGEGTGVFELTLVSDISTDVGVKFGSGNGNLTIEDPYHLMFISEQDIQKAIADVYNPAKATQLFQFSENELSKQTNKLNTQLNNLRQGRGVPLINIRTNFDSILYKRVSVFIDLSGLEILFNYDPGLLGIGAKVEFEPVFTDTTINQTYLTVAEADLLSDIIRNTYQIMNLRKDKDRDLNISAIDDGTDEGIRLKNEIQYVEEKLRLHFLNKNIIQPMDEVHVYISSKTMVDSKVIGVDQATAFGTSGNLLNKLNSRVSSLEQSFNNLKGFFGASAGGSFVEIEKSAIVGPDFPTWLWLTMRNDFTRQSAGPHVFAGVVSEVNENYSNGKYTLSVSMEDNTSFFKMGQINTKPSTEVVEREIYDPFTPFKLDFDSSGFVNGETPQLLQENVELIRTGDIKFKNGSRFLGSPLSESLYIIGDNAVKDAGQMNTIQKQYYDPDGFVYRWKSGISTYTRSGPKYYNSLDPNHNIQSPSLTKDYLAGQDIMNCLSLIICSIPYNYNSFLTSAIKSGNLSFVDKNPQNNNLDNVDVAVSFFRSFISDLKKNNLTWGSFVPFKKLTISEKGLEFLISGQFSIQKNNQKISELLDKRSKIFDTLTLINKQSASNVNTLNTGSDGAVLAGEATDTEFAGVEPEVVAAEQKIIELDTQIEAQRNQLLATISDSNTNNGQLKIFGDDVSFDPTYSEIGDDTSEREFERARLNLRKKLKFLTQRRLWKVKSNQDQNLLIIDDSYDKDYDIQAFSQALAGKMDLLRSEYHTPATAIQAIASIMGLEVFADTQGHINIKPPGYNKMPSSVFYRMISDGRRMYPKQLEALFVGQADNLINRIEIIEDEIRLNLTALGFETDEDSSKYLSGTGTGGAFNSKGSFTFAFVTSPEGNFGSKGTSIKSMINQTNPDVRQDFEKRPLKQYLETISGQLRKTALFDTLAQVDAARNKAVFQPKGVNTSRYETIRDRLKIKKGQQVKTIQELLSNPRGTNSNIRSQTDVININKALSQLVSERQNLLKTLQNAIKNIDEGSQINNNPKASKGALFPSLFREESIPSVLEHMIEDENEDDLGFGSGGRYIIKENQIINMSLSENKPEFTAIEVNGLFDGTGLVSPPTSLDVGSSGGFTGNTEVSALSVDYDMWRMYGFQLGSARSAPFLSDAETQAAPLAVWMLNEQRRNILKGSLTIIGNEYMQPGEVIYIEGRDLLFYVEKVSHSFSYGGSFTTRLSLSFGHNPGEYFPTMLDIVGKSLYSKRYQSNLVKHVRQGNANGYEHLGALMVEQTPSAGLFNSESLDRLVAGKFGDKNRNVLTNILIALKASETQNVTPQIELRLYKNSSKNQPSENVTNSLSSVCDEVKTWLRNPSKRNFGPNSNNTGTEASIGPEMQSEGLKFSGDIDSIIKTVIVDEEDFRSPSGQAILYAKEVLSTNPSGSSYMPTEYAESEEAKAGQESGLAGYKASRQAQSNALSAANAKNKNEDITAASTASPMSLALYSSIIDIWIKFVPKTSSVETSTRTNLGNSQALNENAAKLKSLGQ